MYLLNADLLMIIDAYAAFDVVIARSASDVAALMCMLLIVVLGLGLSC